MKKHIAIILSIVMVLSVIPVFASASSTLPAPKLYNHSAGKTSIKNYWSKVDGADGYQLYRAMKKNGKYEQIATTKNRYYVSKNLKTWQDRYYKVRAYKLISGKKVPGKFSTVQSAAPIEKASYFVTFNVVEHKKASKYQTIRITNKTASEMMFWGNGVSFSPYFGKGPVTSGDIYSASNTKSKYPTRISLEPGKSVTLKCLFSRSFTCSGDSIMSFSVSFDGYMWGAFFANDHGYEAGI